ncbi:putative transcriptional regulator, MerR family [Rippkaea orientalis PCC 8801]|uniref:Putative transcriptional regulator, MerR family n=1 Tax=Rippkaea orientalis (strain PCC 8801 / RF-1) TaxID=41431 RepID=B7K587_RIPO1|nr:MerR family transcriptional regulator [Rippkaea orientalis]ACK67913.1 putative transcriptional regulator, MerR family [Rippkaea orientalis PCC 8801]
MGEIFFTSKDAAKITGCTLRQLQYWREKGVIVPMVSATGTGRSVYYSHADLVELTVMVYLLWVGLTFETATGILQQLREIEPNFAKENSQRRLMLVFDTSEGILKLRDFERESAVSFAVPSATLFWWIKVCLLFLCGWIGFVKN